MYMCGVWDFVVEDKPLSFHACAPIQCYFKQPLGTVTNSL